MPRHPGKYDLDTDISKRMAEINADLFAQEAAARPTETAPPDVSPEQQAKWQDFISNFSLAGSSQEQYAQYYQSPFAQKQRTSGLAAQWRPPEEGWAARNLFNPILRAFDVAEGAGAALSASGSAFIDYFGLDDPDHWSRTFLDPLGAPPANPEKIAFGLKNWDIITQNPGQLLQPGEFRDRLIEIQQRVKDGEPGGPGTIEQIALNPLSYAGLGLTRTGYNVIRALPEIAVMLKAGARPGVRHSFTGMPEEIQAVVRKMNPYFEDVTAAAKVVASDIEREGAARVGYFARLQEEKIAEEFVEAQMGAVDVLNPFEVFEESLSKALGGPMDRGRGLGFGFKNPLSDEETHLLMNYARTFQQTPTDILNNQVAVWTLFVEKKLPQAAQITRMEYMFGRELAENFARIGRMKDGDLTQHIWSAFNLPRAVLATADLSAALRQGRILGEGNPKEWKDAFLASARAFKEEDVAREVHLSIIRHPNYEWIKAGGIEITERGGLTRNVALREEPFMSDWAQRIPFFGRIVNASERAHVTMLNKLRSDVAYKVAAQWRKEGLSLKDDETLKKWKSFGAWINTATGRGPLPQSLQPFAPFMNALFFSPRFNSSRIATPIQLVLAVKRGDKELFREMAKDLSSFVMTNMTILAIADTAFKDVSINYLHPSRPDWLKMKVGPTRMDFWTGYLQHAQFIWRMKMGKEAQKGTKLYDSNLELLRDYIRSKTSPPVGMVWDMLVGETAIGEPVNPSEIEDIGKMAYENAMPLAVQALLEGLREGNKHDGWPLAGLLSIGEVMGVSVSAYTTHTDAQEKASMDTLGKPYDYLSVAERQQIEDHPLMREAQAKFDARERAREENPLLSVDDGVRDGWRRMGERKTEVEGILRELIMPLAGADPAVKGASLLNAIREYKTQSAEMWDTIFTPKERDYISKRRESGPTLEVFRDRYWSIEPSIYTYKDGTRMYNFQVQEEGRRAVLLAAGNAGVNRDDVTAKSETRFTDPWVRHVIEMYERDMEWLKPYFNLPQLIIEDEALFELYQSQELEENWPPELRRLSSTIKSLRITMRQNRPGIDDLLLKYGFVTKRVVQRTKRRRRG